MLTDEPRLQSRPPLTGPGLRVPLAVLAGWTLFVWSNRILNVAEDNGLSGFATAWRLAVAVGFVAAATALVAGLVAAWRRRDAAPPEWSAAVGLVLSLVTILWWPPRTISTLLGDYSLGFKGIHTVLALASIGIGVWVLTRIPNSPLSRFLSQQG